ncbi:MAG: methyltransferase domain-containing protein [Planctomycetota bacterium]
MKTPSVHIAGKARGFHRPGLLGREPSLFREYFTDMILQDGRLGGDVLDAGCGTSGPDNTDIQRVYDTIGTLDGVDPASPDEGVDVSRWYRERWTGMPQDVGIPREAYDAVISFNVLEHVDDPAVYMTTCVDALKPGGVMYAYGPHGLHPFAVCVRLVERLSDKRKLLDATNTVGNDYPAYYRLSTRRRLEKAVRGLPVESIEVHYHPSLQWKSYFPSSMKWMPWIYDRAIGVHCKGIAQQFFFKLEKSKDVT